MALFSSYLQSFPASINIFANESILHIRWPKYWSFSFNISPSNEYLGLISFRMERLDLLAVQGTLKSLLQHHSSKVSILWCSAFFMVLLSHPYMIRPTHSHVTHIGLQETYPCLYHFSCIPNMALYSVVINYFSQSSTL